MRQIPRPFETYRHFKGNCYQVIAIAKHSETGEQMVVYQQLYAPYEMYVRPLNMFMSKVDHEKYPQAQQEYRFESIQDTSVQQPVTQSEPTIQPVPEMQQQAAPQDQEPELVLEPGLLAFLEAESYESKLEILNQLHQTITDSMIDTMAVSLDIEVKAGDIEQRYQEIMNCLLTMERFECNRLR